MEALTFTSTSSESFPKRIRSASARLFSLNHNNNSNANGKRISFMSNSEGTTNILNPTKWFPRMRCRSASSAASSTSSVVFSTSSTTTTSQHTILDHLFHNHHHHQHHSTAAMDQHVDHANNSLISLEAVSSELEDLYRDAREEIEYAIESQGSIYYEGDKATAHAAFELCETKYDTVMQQFGDTTNAIKFRFRWETDLHQLRSLLSNLPPVTESIYE
ncbi:hypothetical protein MAM1_0006c00752 [Mucor ambiguus]|uniref:Uncharacterized protein n=1 Tax=Mucor ambiguus TaxID=91626 RepID=A0A0C9M4R9_9FUNG|nr:hypothetical protein MAM1_0006c00752 [Mucor ambiguus]